MSPINEHKIPVTPRQRIAPMINHLLLVAYLEKSDPLVIPAALDPIEEVMDDSMTQPMFHREAEISVCAWKTAPRLPAVTVDQMRRANEQMKQYIVMNWKGRRKFSGGIHRSGRERNQNTTKPTNS
jgi:hypothetical protein